MQSAAPATHVQTRVHMWNFSHTDTESCHEQAYGDNMTLLKVQEMTENGMLLLNTLNSQDTRLSVTVSAPSGQWQLSHIIKEIVSNPWRPSLS